MVSTAQIKTNVVLGMFNKVTYWINWCSVVFNNESKGCFDASDSHLHVWCRSGVRLSVYLPMTCRLSLWHHVECHKLQLFYCLCCLWKQCTVPFMFRTLFCCNFCSRKVMCCYRRIMLAHVMHVLLSKMFLAGMIVRLIYTVWFTGSFSLSTTLTVLCQQMQKAWNNVAG